MNSSTSTGTWPRGGGPSSSPRLQTAGRCLIGLLFIASGLHKAYTFEGVVGWMNSLGVPWAALALKATIVLEVVGGVALATGRRLRLWAGLLAAFVVAATVIFHAFWSAPVEQFGDQLTHFLKNVAIVGGLVLLVAGRPSH